MPGVTFLSPAGRINKLKGEILAHSIPVEVLGITGQQKSMEKNKGNQVVYRRYIPYGATTANQNTINRWSVSDSAHLLAEGVTPTADALVPQDITVQLNQYGCLYQLTDVANDLYEDDLPAEMKQQCGERVGLVREMVRYGVIKGCTNKFWGGTGSTRATVNGKLTLALLRRMSKNLAANHASRITSVLAPSAEFATAPVEAAFLVFASTDLENDIRDLPNFKAVVEYGQRRPVHEQELGSCENYRFILSPELSAYADAATSVTAANFNLVSTTGTNPDVYPVIVCGKDAWGQLALRGMNSGLDPTYIPPGTKDKNDPLGQRGYIGAKFYMNAMILNAGWMAVAEVGATNI